MLSGMMPCKAKSIDTMQCYFPLSYIPIPIIIIFLIPTVPPVHSSLLPLLKVLSLSPYFSLSVFFSPCLYFLFFSSFFSLCFPKTHSLFLTDASMRAIKSNCSGGSCINSILCTHKGNDILKGREEKVSREKART